MKNIFLLILFASTFAFSQPETSKNLKKNSKFPILASPDFKSTPKALDLKPEKQNPFSNQETFNSETPIYKSNANILGQKKEPSFVIGENRDNILNQPTFINPNLDVLDKLNGKTPKPVSEDFVAIRGNQDLGNFNVVANSLVVKYRDFGEIDGDQIKILVNGVIVVNRIGLDYEFGITRIELKKGFNKIEFEALNQGRVGPNTAELQVFDDKGNLVSQNSWNLVTGFKASIMVFKE